MQTIVAIVEAQVRKVLLKGAAGCRTALNDEAAGLVFHDLEEALDCELVRQGSIFFEKGDSEDNSLSLRIYSTEEDNVAAEACLLKTFVEEDEVLVSVILDFHLGCLVEKIGRAIVSVLLELDCKSVLFSLLFQRVS